MMWRAILPALPARHRGVTLAGFLVVGALALTAVLASHILPGSPTEIAKDHALRGPTWAEPFGFDDLGRSILSRVGHAYRVSLGVALASVGLALLAGVPLGLVAGYAEGALDQLIMRPLDVLMSFPAILLAIALMSVFGTGVALVALSLAVVYTPIVARVVRAAVLAVKVELYVDGARALGAPVLRLVLRHILPTRRPRCWSRPRCSWRSRSSWRPRSPSSASACAPRRLRWASCSPTAAASWCRRPGW